MTPHPNIPELRRLLEAATPGKWRPGTFASMNVTADDPRETIVCDVTGSPGNAQAVADRDLIVALRNAADFLLRAAEERDALRSEKSRLLHMLQDGAALVSWHKTGGKWTQPWESMRDLFLRDAREAIDLVRDAPKAGEEGGREQREEQR